jgi:DNA-directed RNA polymerase subunit alpha
VKIDDALHEYSVISEVREDVSEIILNLKELKLKVEDTEEKILTLKAKGEGKITGADIVSPDGKVEILNPEQHIATLSKNGSLNMTMVVKTGKGYALASANKDEDAPIGTIPIDSVFSPIKRVKYVVGTSRIGQKTDYDKLTLEVWTDGSVTPDDAVAYGAKILKEQMNPFINFDEELEPDDPEENAEDSDKGFNENIYRSVDELELSVRSSNCLKNARINTIYQLVQKTDSEMLKTKNFGRKSLNEIKEVLHSMDLSLGMDLEGFEPPPEDENQQEGE